MKRRFTLIPLTIIALTVVWCNPAHAYIGPGAGFAIVSSFLTMLVAFGAAALALLLWPIRRLRTWLIGHRYRAGRKVRRVIILGLDGLDPGLADRYLERGLLPNFARLAETGAYRRLGTTFPAISPVAWSTFATGVNPGKHRIFDFYTRDPRTYAPVLSSSRIATVPRRIGIGRFSVTLRRTVVRFLRKSTSFWRILGDARVFCSINRVPVTFPPEKHYGVSLAAMCTPDLRGTQGAFTQFREHDGAGGSGLSDGTILNLEVTGDRFSGSIPGPTLRRSGATMTLEAPFTGTIDRTRRQAAIMFDGDRLTLDEGIYSPWITLTFRAGRMKKITGIARLLLTGVTGGLTLYVTPINIDPERPSMPVSHPGAYAVSLAKVHGSFATLGLAEDTWALNERIIDEDAFLRQSYDIFEERKCHLFDAMAKNPDGVVATVVDTTDRIQHMFFRTLDDDHPANRDRDASPYRTVIEDLYRHADKLVGEVMDRTRPGDLVMVMSDHGFAQFKWGVNLNTWLRREGYLVLNDGAGTGGKWFEDVDWSRTRAYACGLAGIFLNVRGRERQGIVAPGKEREQLAREIADKLTAFVDTEHGATPIRRVAIASETLSGPYVNEAHDLLVGYEPGYRASWNSAVGMVSGEIIEENTKCWSGDHCIDPAAVPGVLFTNWPLADESPAMQDIAPTLIDLFGLPPQTFHDGSVLTFTPPDPKEAVA